MITESEIEKCVTQLEENPQIIEEIQEDFKEYLQAEIIPSLNTDEKHILLFCLSVIFNACHHKFGKTEFDLDDYLDMEDQNWSFRDKDKAFEESLNSFFTSYHEEDLLAFVEDMLVDDDEQELSTAGKEIIFISCKSSIDVLVKVNT